MRSLLFGAFLVASGTAACDIPGCITALAPSSTYHQADLTVELKNNTTGHYFITAPGETPFFNTEVAPKDKRIKEYGVTTAGATFTFKAYTLDNVVTPIATKTCTWQGTVNLKETQVRLFQVTGPPQLSCFNW